MLSRFLNFISRRGTHAWRRRFARLNPQVQFGDHLRLMSRPNFDVASDARVRICSYVTLITAPGVKLTIGDGCGFSGVSNYCALEISIGSHLTCGASVCIWDTDYYPFDAAARRANDRSAIARQPVVIGHDVFLGANVLVLKGARIGDPAFIGAGSVVTGEVPANEIWAGNTARLVRRMTVGQASSLSQPSDPSVS